MAFLLYHSVDEAAQRRPEHEAFRFEERSVSYADLAVSTNRLARFLVEDGVRRGDRVGVYMNKGLELPRALYGILKAGGAYVPIDPTAPPARVQFILRDCGIRTLITDRAHTAKATTAAQEATELQTVVGAEAPANAPDPCRFVPRFVPWRTVDQAPAEPPQLDLAERDFAYVMYTSGSTGVPKGLIHTHSSGGAYARYSGEFYDVRPDDLLGNHSPLHFDMSTFEYLTGPHRGATTVIIPEEVTLFPISLAELIERERLTFWYSVPLALIQLLDRGGIEERDIRSLRWVLFGGEPLAPKYLARLAKIWPETRFSNSYGPAEVNQCTAFTVPLPVDLENPVPIGPTWPGAAGLVVDEDDREVPSGKSGELLIRSETMMSGYWNRPDLDARAFFRRNSPDGESEVFYRTGDLVRDRGDGALVFLGRKDRLVKVRGYRVELDEVEAVLNAMPGVSEAAVVDLRDEEGAASIAAAAIPRRGAELTPEDLRREAARLLPPYAVPTRSEVRDAFPRTGTGKIDRPALRRELAEGDAPR